MFDNIFFKAAGGIAGLALLIGGYVGVDQLATNEAMGVPDGYTYAVDSYGGLTYEEAVGMEALGVTLYVQALSALPPQGLVQPGDRVQSLRNAYEAGLGIAGYALVGCDGSDGYQDMNYARSGIPEDLWNAMTFVAVDVEIRCQTFDRMEQALDQVESWGKGRIVYTNANWWLNYAGNPTRSEGTVLWNASWDDNPDIDYLRRPFGGFTIDEVFGEQWMGGSFPAGCVVNCNITYVAGQNVDKNVFRYTPQEPGGPVITPPGCAPSCAPYTVLPNGHQDWGDWIYDPWVEPSGHWYSEVDGQSEWCCVQPDGKVFNRRLINGSGSAGVWFWDRRCLHLGGDSWNCFP